MLRAAAARSHVLTSRSVPGGTARREHTPPAPPEHVCAEELPSTALPARQLAAECLSCISQHGDACYHEPICIFSSRFASFTLLPAVRGALFFFSLGRSAVPPLPLEYFQSYLQDRIPFMFQEAGSKTSVLLTTKNPHRSPAWRYRLLSPPALPVPVLGWEPGMRNPTCLTFPRRNTYLALSFRSSPRSTTSSASFQLSPAASC